MSLHRLRRRGLRAALAFASLALAGCQQAYFRALNAPARNVNPHTEVYDRANGLSLDVYPALGDASPAPVVVFLYGGSWQHGRREYYRFVGNALSARGVVVIVPDYRKAPRNRFPAFIEDAAAATAWAHANADALGGDPNRIYVMGHSAGAHIAALVGTDARYLARWNLHPRQLGGVIGLAGPYDFEPTVNARIERRVFAGVSDWPRTQPVHFVDGDEPPFLLLHGQADRKVWVANSESLARRLRAAGDSVTLRILPGVGHIGLVNGFYSPRFSPALAETVDWIRQGPPAPMQARRLASPR
jgi:acetyl esterase/lipase